MRANIEDYRHAARRFPPDFAYGYLEGGAENEITYRRNRRAERGCGEVLTLLRREMEICMRLLGCADLGGLNSSFLLSDHGGAHRREPVERTAA